MPAVIQLKRGLLQNLPGLQSGEPGFTTDSYDLYVGLTSSTATNQLVGSGRFWTNNTTTKGSGVNLVEGTDNGTSYVTIASPDSLAGIVTYYMPGTQGDSDTVLTNDGSGNLTWGSGGLQSFPTGDYGDFSSPVNDAFGQPISGFIYYDCLDEPADQLRLIDLGVLT